MASENGVVTPVNRIEGALPAVGSNLAADAPPARPSDVYVGKAVEAIRKVESATAAYAAIGKAAVDGARAECKADDAISFVDALDDVWGRVEKAARLAGYAAPGKSRCVKIYALCSLAADAHKLPKSVAELLSTLVRFNSKSGAALWGKYEDETRALIARVVRDCLPASEAKKAIDKIRGRKAPTKAEKAAKAREKRGEQFLAAIETLDVSALAELLRSDDEAREAVRAALAAADAAPEASEDGEDE